MPQPIARATAKPRNGKPDANEFGQVRSFLARNRPTGVPANEWNERIKAVIGDSPAGRSRAEIAELLRAWMRTFPKAE